jgi:NhaP-type Na+/H+ or K+/H+ antiporter
LGLIHLSAVRDAELLERITEIAVIISLFSAGLKLRAPLTDGIWRPALRLASISMCLTVALVTLVGTVALGLPLGAAVLLGAVLAPTDPVLASDVQVEDAQDRDRLRFSLTGEAGFNDGTAFPFVMLGLGLLGLHDLGEWGWRWVMVDVVWAITGGLGIGALLGMLVGRLVIYLRREHRESVGTDDFLALGLIAFSYGAALIAHTYGFLAVFAAGLALRATERTLSDDKTPPEISPDEAMGEVATDAEKAPAVMAQAVQMFNEQLERIGEVGVVVLVGGMLTLRGVPGEAWWFVPLLFFVIRPVAVSLGLIGARVGRLQRNLIAWFGIRGIGSLYYLTYAVEHGLPAELAQRLSEFTLTVMAVSIVAHGVSVTPLMNLYSKKKRTAN